MFRKSYLKNYKWIMGSLALIGVILILVSRLLEEGHHPDYVAGLGVGLVFASVLNLIIVRIKMRNSTYEEELEIEMQDERVKLNKMKSLAYGGIFMVVVLCFLNMLNVFIGFDMTLSNIIVLFSYIISVAFFKWYFRNR